MPIATWNNWVHPHARGDDAHACDEQHSAIGPPPRAWGRLADQDRPPLRPRSTPPRVGTTGCRPAGSDAGAVHPHARGDDGCMKHHILPHDGPPPRAWGRPLRACVLPSVLRSTPTRVGTTLWLICRQIGGPVHPHARGDDVLSPRTIDHRGGPPPRAWGRLEAGDLVREQNRSTPTRVGTTPFAPRRWSLSTVHPHARGDDGKAAHG